MTNTIRKLRLVDLDRSTQVQSRVKTDPERLEEYQKAWEKGEADFPPCIVYQDGEKLYIADGFHRIQSKMKAEMDQKVEYRTIECEVRQGSIEQAIEYSLGANLRHGLRPNTADKKRAILLYYGLSADHCYHSANEVAKACGASHTFVGAWKKTCADTPIDITAAETNIPAKELKQTIENIIKAIASGKIITTRGGKELTQSERKTPKPIDPDVNRHHHYIFFEPNAELGVERGTIVSGFESLTDTGMLALAGRDGQVLVSESEVIKLPYPVSDRVATIDDGTEVVIQSYEIIGTDLKIRAIDDNGFKHNGSASFFKPIADKPAPIKKDIGAVEIPFPLGTKVCQIEAGTELTVTGYVMVGTDLKIKTVDRHGFARTDLSTTLKPYTEPSKNIGAVEIPTPPILNLSEMSDVELEELRIALFAEFRRRSSSQDVPNLPIS